MTPKTKAKLKNLAQEVRKVMAKWENDAAVYGAGYLKIDFEGNVTNITCWDLARELQVIENLANPKFRKGQ